MRRFGCSVPHPIRLHQADALLEALCSPASHRGFERKGSRILAVSNVPNLIVAHWCVQSRQAPQVDVDTVGVDTVDVASGSHGPQEALCGRGVMAPPSAYLARKQCCCRTLYLR